MTSTSWLRVLKSKPTLSLESHIWLTRFVLAYSINPSPHHHNNTIQLMRRLLLECRNKTSVQRIRVITESAGSSISYRDSATDTRKTLARQVKKYMYLISRINTPVLYQRIMQLFKLVSRMICQWLKSESACCRVFLSVWPDIPLLVVIMFFISFSKMVLFG